MQLAVAVLSLLLAAPAAPLAPDKPSLPRDIGDYYELLARDQKIERALVKQGAAWAYAEKLDDEPLTGKGAPVVDVKNGYVRFAFQAGAADEQVEMALFIAKGGRKFVGVAHSGHAGDAELSGVRFYAFTGASYADATGELGVQLKLDEFLDEAYVVSKQAETDQLAALATLALMVVHLPQKGTTVTVQTRLAENPPPIEDPPSLADAARLLHAHRKYQTVELVWSSADARFSIGKKE